MPRQNTVRCGASRVGVEPHSTRNKPIVPVVYQDILEPGIGQFRESEPRRMHTAILQYIRLFFFSCALIDSRKARERELATLVKKIDENGIAEPYARYKWKARTGREKGRHR